MPGLLPASVPASIQNPDTHPVPSEAPPSLSSSRPSPGVRAHPDLCPQTIKEVKREEGQGVEIQEGEDAGAGMGLWDTVGSSWPFF